MEKFENKKSAVLLLLAGVGGIVIAYILSESYYFVNGGYYKAINANYALENGYEIKRVVEFFHFKLPFKGIVVFLILTIATSIYLFIYKTDDEVKSALNSCSAIFKTRDSSLLRKVFSFYTTDSEVKAVQLTEEQSALEEIMVSKNFNTLFGVLLLIIQLFLWNIGIENIAVMFVVQLGIRFFGAYRCNKVAEYNIWGSGTWFVLGFIFPSIALILSGIKSTLRKDVNLTFEKSSEESNEHNYKIDLKDACISHVPVPSETEIVVKKEVEVIKEAFSIDEFNSEQKERVKKTISNVYNQLTKSKGIEPDFRALLVNMVKYAGNETAKKQFNAYVLGWKLNMYADADFEKAYDSVFNNFDDIVL